MTNYNNNNGNNRNYNNNNNRNYNNNNGYYNNNNGGNNNNQGYGPKRSWVIYNYLKDAGVTMANAFRVTKRFGLIKYTVKPYHKTFVDKNQTEPVVVTTEKSNKTYHKMICIIETEFTAPQTIPVLFCIESKKIVIAEKGLVISPVGNGRLRNGRSVSGGVYKVTK